MHAVCYYICPPVTPCKLPTPWPPAPVPDTHGPQAVTATMRK